MQSLRGQRRGVGRQALGAHAAPALKRGAGEGRWARGLAPGPGLSSSRFLCACDPQHFASVDFVCQDILQNLLWRRGAKRRRGNLPPLSLSLSLARSFLIFLLLLFALDSPNVTRHASAKAALELAVPFSQDLSVKFWPPPPLLFPRVQKALPPGWWQNKRNALAQCAALKTFGLTSFCFFWVFFPKKSNRGPDPCTTLETTAEGFVGSKKINK